MRLILNGLELGFKLLQKELDFELLLPVLEELCSAASLVKALACQQDVLGLPEFLLGWELVDQALAVPIRFVGN